MRVLTGRTADLLLGMLSLSAVGIFDGALGDAWPSMRVTFGQPLAALGVALAAYTSGYFLTSSAGGWLLEPGARAHGSLLTLTEVREVHEMALGLAWDVARHPNATDRERPGSFREHDIQPFPSGMTPPSWTEVPAEIGDWVDSVNEVRDSSRPLEALAMTHNRFEQIHPFLDGNGRTGRLLLNLVLVRMAYAPVIIYTRDRARYLGALRSADAGDAGPLGEMLARSVLDNLYRFIMPAVAGPNRLVPLAALATKELTEGSLRVAANRGRLRAQKAADGQWRSTKAWVAEYLKSRYERLPKTSTRPSAGGP